MRRDQFIDLPFDLFAAGQVHLDQREGARSRLLLESMQHVLSQLDLVVGRFLRGGNGRIRLRCQFWN